MKKPVTMAEYQAKAAAAAEKREAALRAADQKAHDAQEAQRK